MHTLFSRDIKCLVFRYSTNLFCIFNSSFPYNVSQVSLPAALPAALLADDDVRRAATKYPPNGKQSSTILGFSLADSAFCFPFQRKAKSWLILLIQWTVPGLVLYLLSFTKLPVGTPRSSTRLCVSLSDQQENKRHCGENCVSDNLLGMQERCPRHVRPHSVRCTDRLCISYVRDVKWLIRRCHGAGRWLSWNNKNQSRIYRFEITNSQCVSGWTDSGWAEKTGSS